MMSSSALSHLIIGTIALIASSASQANPESTDANSKVMFDDFSYKTLAEAQKMAGCLELK